MDINTGSHYAPRPREKQKGLVQIAMYATVALFAFLFLVGIIVNTLKDDPADLASGVRGAVQQRQFADDALQARREEAIERYQAERVIQKIDTPGTLPRVYVLPRFYAMTFDAKEACARLVMAWCYKIPLDAEADAKDMLLVYDAMNNKQVGTCTRTGLDLE